MQEIEPTLDLTRNLIPVKNLESISESIDNFDDLLINTFNITKINELVVDGQCKKFYQLGAPLDDSELIQN